MISLTSPSVNLQLHYLYSLHRPRDEIHGPHLHSIDAFPNSRFNLKPTANKPPDLLLSVEKIEKETIHTLLQSFTRSQLLEILEEAAIVHPNILHTILSMIDDDPSHRKLFVRSLGPNTTSQSLHEFFSRYGFVEEAKVVFDKASGISKGYGFVTFANTESFLLALKKPSKKIEGFVSFSSVCVESDSFSRKMSSGGGSIPNSDDKLKRTIKVENVPVGMSSETLLDFFGKYGEIQEGPGGFDMGTGQSKGFAYFLYEDKDSAKAALAEPYKTVDGFNLFCKKAKETEKNSKVGLGLEQSLPTTTRIMVLPILYYYYYFSCFRGLATYNCYQNQSEFAIASGSGGGDECGSGGIAFAGRESSSIMNPAPSDVGGSHPRPGAS